MESAHRDIEDLVFHTLLESPVPVAIFSWRATGRWPVEFVSPNVSHVIGYEADDFLSGRVAYAEAIHPDDLARVTREVAEHSASDESVFEHEDYRVIDPQGHARWVRDLTAIIRDDQGTITHFIGYIFESTARHAALDALSLAKREAEAATAAKTEFFANVSHEFRTPLTLLLGPIDDLLTGPLEASQRQLLQTMQRSALRLQRLVNTLLDFAPIDAGRVSATFEPTELAAYTRDLASFFQSAAAAAELDFVVECAPLEEPVWVDREMWEKIVSNLLSNAIKFTLVGGIQVRVRADDGNAILEVEDTGIGIPAAELPQLFERFHRIRGTRARSQEGTGIGLPLVQELVRLHGGKVSARSTEGVGTTFTVAIPRGHSHLPAEQVELKPTPQPPSGYASEAARWIKATGEAATTTTTTKTTTAGLPRVVLVDDNADMRAYLVQMLGAGYDVEAFADGKQALEGIQQHELLPDMVITDVMMPVMDGFELLAALRADPQTRALPIIMLSARAGEEARVEGIEAGADDYLVKPFSARELLARVGTQLALAQMRRQAEQVAGLEAEQAWLAAALDHMPIPLVLAEPESGRITFANRAATKMAGGTYPLGVHRADYPGHFHITDERDRPIPVEQWPVVRAARGEKVEAAVIVWHTPAGRFPLLVNAETLPTMSGHPAVVVVGFQDVSELVRAIRARDDFLSIASHELKTPLTSLRLQVQMRERALAGGHASIFAPESLARMVSSDVRQIDRLTRLVDDILDVSRISSGRFALTIGEPVDLTTVVREVLERSSAALAAAACDTTLQAPSSPVLGRWDRARVEQVVLNLLTNSMKYGRGRPIRCTVAAVDGRAIFSIRDEGMGIAPSDHERIFQIFERAVSANEVSGLGLGLYIARRIVEAHGGTIGVVSALGQGSTFTVELPREPPGGGGP
ncbi:MAG: ATP-binding protein [Deltaproteobacteria bacterium]|nr:ATP-binding protein [Deltaproteobacteria bacterium]